MPDKPNTPDVGMALVWQLIYGEELEKTPNPNLPENIPFMKALARDRREKLKQFVSGVGKPVIDIWKKQLREQNIVLLAMPYDKLCACPACLLLRTIKPKLEMITELEMILSEGKTE
jgi:hypothetical protein